jgi:subtilisin-like proprotein convertase family protein/uncharacterized protein YceK
MIVGVIGTPEVGATTTTIQSYIHNLYNTGAPAPSFVLFVGDVAQCPTFSTSNGVSDREYCDIENDLFPEMYYGRFSATNAGELQSILDKTMMYDQFTMPDPSYLGNAVMIAGMDGGFGDSHGNGQINYGTEHYFNAAHGINSNTYLYPNSGSNSANIVQNVSDGVAYINYTAHGSDNSWSDPSFTQSNINGLSNSGKYTLAVGNCCLTSTYENPECFAETWLRAEDKGAIGYIGGSNSTYWDEDYWWGVGFHPSAEINGTAYPIADTGIGVYDGLFHDTGQAEHLHYVTNDALVFSGNLAVTESGSTLTEYYWNIYNLMGDPSLSVYYGVPEANPVSHLPILFTTNTAFDITAAPGSYVGLTQNGVIMAAGTVDASGSASFVLDTLLTPGTAHIVVMAQNLEPYIVDVNVIVPATISIVPSVIDVNTTTDLTVTVLGADGITPQVGVNVWAEGVDYSTTPVATNASGVAVVTVNYQYGPILGIIGQETGQPYLLFTEQVAVNAAAFTTPDLTVSTDIGMVDMFALNLPGTLHSTVGEPGTTLYGIAPDGTVTSSGTGDLTLTPAETGFVTGLIAKSGYDLYTEDFEVIEAFGTMTGHVDAAGVNAAGAIVVGSDAMGTEVFTATCDASGNYDVGSDILVADYTITVDYFGYLPYEDSFFVNYGANTNYITLVAAPSGVLTGFVFDSDTFEPLEGIVRIYRPDTGDLYAEAICDATGEYTTTQLPYFTYNVVVRAYHHVPVQVEISIEAPVTEKDFDLLATNGDILIISHGVKGTTADKLDEKGNLIASGYTPVESKTTADLVADLEYLGYSAQVEDINAINPADWVLYDMLLMTAGDNTSDVPAGFQTALTSFAAAGGHYIVEGGEVFYNHNGSGFGADVLHCADWDGDSSGSVTVADAAHYVMSVPNVITGPITVAYAGYGDQDSVSPTADAVMVGGWTEGSSASVITYDSNPAPAGGQYVGLCFNYSAMDIEPRQQLLQNAVTWLLALEIGNCSVSGTVTLQGETNHAGIAVEALPGGGSTVTAADGSYSFPGLYAGTYNIRASKQLWSVAIVDVTLEDGQNLTGIDMLLTPIQEMADCSQPALAIPDNNPAGVSDTMTLALPQATVANVEVYVDITHTWQGDLLLNLTSPEGTTVVLHDRTGSSDDNIYGWYPEELTPAGDLGLFAGEILSGDWTLFVSDNAGADTGTLNEWCLTIEYGGVQPVMLSNSSVVADADGVHLSWELSLTEENIYFNVLRSPAGENNFAELDITPEVSSPLSYLASDTSAEPGVSYNYQVNFSLDDNSSVLFTSEAIMVPTMPNALHRNVPNPFNPSTKITYDLSQPSMVKLTIYDIAGRVVCNLVNEHVGAGRHDVIWAGKNNKGEPVTSGVYFYLVEAGGFRQSKRMMLVK